MTQITHTERSTLRREMPSLDRIIQVVADYYLCTVAEIHQRSRRHYVVHPRQVAGWLAHRRCGRALEEIGDAINRDHTSVLAGVRNIDRQLLVDEKLGAQIGEIERTLGTTPATTPKATAEAAISSARRKLLDRERAFANRKAGS